MHPIGSMHPRSTLRLPFFHDIVKFLGEADLRFPSGLALTRSALSAAENRLTSTSGIPRTTRYFLPADISMTLRSQMRGLTHDLSARFARQLRRLRTEDASSGLFQDAESRLLSTLATIMHIMTRHSRKRPMASTAHQYSPIDPFRLHSPRSPSTDPTRR